VTRRSSTSSSSRTAEPGRAAAPGIRVRRRLRRLLGGASLPGGTAPGRKGPERHALVEGSRFELAVVGVLKNEASYIEEWICHHLAVGVQHFFLYDNGSTDDIHGVLEGYLNRGIVTLGHFPMRGLQRDAYNHALRFFGGACRWLAYIDVDEFLVPAGDEDVPTILRRFPDASQVLVSRKEFCFSGHRSRPPGLVTEAYTLASRDVPRIGRADILAKTIVRPDRVWRMGVHSADTVDRATVNAAGEPSPEGRPAIANPTFANLQINHYYTKSGEEFSAKLARVNTSTHAYRLPEVPFDIPGEPDRAVERWVPRTKALLDRMGQLSPRPFRYGSHLALSDFPRSDQLGAQAASMISNEIAGLAEPRKQRAFDSLPQAGLRGAVARAEDHGYEARAGRLSGSIHVAHQIAWMEGDVAWSLWEDDQPTVDGATLDRQDAPAGWRMDVVGPDARLVIEPTRSSLRQHALLFAIRVASPARLVTSLQETGSRWEDGPVVALPGEGTYLGFIALDDQPHALDGLRLAVPGAQSFEILDLVLVAFG
jgi:Glycosyltransferase family 92